MSRSLAYTVKHIRKGLTLFNKAKDPYKWKLDVLEVDEGVKAEIMRRCSVEGN